MRSMLYGFSLIDFLNIFEKVKLDLRVEDSYSVE